MKDALSIPVLEDNDNDVESVRRCLSSNYVKFRSQNTQAREWRLHPEKRKRTLMYAQRQPSSWDYHTTPD